MIIALGVIAYVIAGLATARWQFTRMYRNGSWADAYDCVDRWLPIIGAFTLWPLAIAAMWVSRPPKEPKAKRLESRIKELEAELKL